VAAVAFQVAAAVFDDPNTSHSVAVNTGIARDIAEGKVHDAVHATAVTGSGTWAVAAVVVLLRCNLMSDWVHHE
jgi:hypothetical protein